MPPGMRRRCGASAGRRSRCSTTEGMARGCPFSLTSLRCGLEPDQHVWHCTTRRARSWTSLSTATSPLPKPQEGSSLMLNEAVIKRGRRREVMNFASGIFYLAPALIIFCFFLFYPAIKTGWLSLFLTDIRGNPAVFNGIQNYIDIFQSATFLPSLRVSFFFALLIVPATIAVSLLLAVLASTK